MIARSEGCSKYKQDRKITLAGEKKQKVINQNGKNQLQLTPGEPARIVKVKTGSKPPQWKVEKLAGEQPDGTFAIPKETGAGNKESKPAPAPTPGNQSSPAPVNGHGTSFHGSAGRYVAPLPQSPESVAERLCSTVNMLVDVQGSCLEHAKKYNGGVRPEDVRAILLTAYIGMSKGAR